MALPSLKSSFIYDSCKDPEKSQRNFQEIISKAPKNSEWFAFSDLYQYQGFWFTPKFLEGTILAQETFKPQPNDIILCSYPRTGTTWLKSLSFAIMNRNNADSSINPLHSVMPHECVPFLEVDLFQQKSIKYYPKVPLVATHLPYSSLPKSVIDSTCKLVYICRDPKDVFVSLWHFLGNVKDKETKIDEFSLQKGFDLFCNGFSLHGPYWDHVLGYWRASLEFPEKILFIKYEDLKEKTSLHVKRLAEFMGYPFSLDEQREGVVEKIIEICDFHNLRNLEVNKKGEYAIFESIVVQNKEYFRKGQVGDWKNYLTAEMQERLDCIVNQNLQGSGLTLC